MKGKKRILLFIDELGSGGAQRQIVSLARLLKESGKFDVLIVDYYDNKFYDAELKKWCIAFEHVPTKGKWNIIQMFRHYVSVKKPDVVIAYMENPSIVACLTRLTIRHSFRLIVSERNTTQFNDWRTWIRFQLYRFSDYVVPNSFSQQNFIETHFSFLSPKIVTIQNYLDTNRFIPSLNGQISNKVRNGLVVGRVVEQKNVLRVLEALKILKDKGVVLHFDWYGKPFPESYYQKCLETVKSLGLKDYIAFHQPTQQIVEKYQKADFFLLPSIYEGFPNVLCEAMGCGLPVLASRVCDNPNIVAEGDNGFLFDPYSVEDIASKIKEMISLDEASFLRMGQCSRELAMQKFSEEFFLKQYTQLVNNFSE